MGLAYFRDMASRWMNARWAYRVLDWVVKRAGLAMSECMGTDARCFSGRQGVDERVVQEGEVQENIGHVNFMMLGGIETGSDGQVDSSLQSLLEENAFEGFDEHLFGLFGA